MKTKVSFIIPALNEEKRIEALIDNIKVPDKKYNYEIIVADGHSTDQTAWLAEKMRLF
jgi:glycosyltransferase involved in cell wall biosynthesis